MKSVNYQSHQRGAVSLIVVIFTAILVTVITIGFVSLMVRNQQQATQSDLSQSAYDSALAGIEDAKRALLLDKQCQEGTAALSPQRCVEIATLLESGKCDTVNKILGDSSGVTVVGQTEGDKQLQQAYTCATIALDTPDYRGKDLTNGHSHLIPLRVAPGASFNQVEIMWFTQEDAAAASGAETGLDTVSLDIPSGNEVPLTTPTGTPDSAWTTQTPPLLRSQLIQTAGTFNLSQFNDAGGSGDSDSSALFLYPGRSQDPTLASGFGADIKSGKAPKRVICSDTDFENGGYACRVSLSVPSPVGGSESDRTAYLRLTAFYNTTRYRIVLKKDGVVVPFHGVQPEVDVTGRANDIFRRVKARVQLDASYPYPESTLDLEGNLCKDYAVTIDPGRYGQVNRSERCDPRATP